MGLTATNTGGGDFKRVPAGVYVGRCFSVVDLGTQTVKGQFGEKQQHKVRISWELFGEDEAGNPLTVDIEGKPMPMTISTSYTVSLHEKAKMRKDFAAWRGRDFTDDEVSAGFDITSVLDKYCMLNVTTSETNGKTYSNVAGITPLPSALKASKPVAVHQNILFDLDAPNMAVFAKFHEKLQDAIKRSPEGAKSIGAPAGPAAPDDDDIGF